MDDVNDWNEREDGDDGGVVLPSEHRLLEMKRQRGDDTQIDAETSLATAEGVKIGSFRIIETTTSVPK
jgi:hypothetical protein